MPRTAHAQGIRLLPRDEISLEVDAFLIDRQARGLSSGTVAFYRKKLTLWHNLFVRMGLSDVQAFTPQHIRRGLLELSEDHRAGGVHAAFRALHAFLCWYEAEYEPQGWKNPVARVKPPKVSSEPLEPVSTADISKLLATCDRSFNGQRDRAALLTLLDTGCRASEFLALNIGDVNMGTGAIMVRQGKGGKFRTVFVGNKARREVLRYLRLRGEVGDSEALWVTAECGRLTYAGLRHVVRRRAEKAGTPVPGLHDFRRAFALACLRNGVDLISLQRLMGHADLSVLRRYLAQVDADLQQAHARGGPVDRLL
jgi:integrase/recombinase XerD